MTGSTKLIIMEQWEHTFLVEKLENEIDAHLVKVKKSIEYWYLSPEWAVRERIRCELSNVRFVCLLDWYMKVIVNNKQFSYENK